MAFKRTTGSNVRYRSPGMVSIAPDNTMTKTIAFLDNAIEKKQELDLLTAKAGISDKAQADYLNTINKKPVDKDTSQFNTAALGNLNYEADSMFLNDAQKKGLNAIYRAEIFSNASNDIVSKAQVRANAILVENPSDPFLIQKEKNKFINSIKLDQAPPALRNDLTTKVSKIFDLKVVEANQAKIKKEKSIALENATVNFGIETDNTKSLIMDNVQVGYNDKTNSVTIGFGKTKEVSEKTKKFFASYAQSIVLNGGDKNDFFKKVSNWQTQTVTSILAKGLKQAFDKGHYEGQEFLTSLELAVTQDPKYFDTLIKKLGLDYGSPFQDNKKASYINIGGLGNKSIIQALNQNLRSLNAQRTNDMNMVADFNSNLYHSTKNKILANKIAFQSGSTQPHSITFDTITNLPFKNHKDGTLNKAQAYRSSLGDLLVGYNKLSSGSKTKKQKLKDELAFNMNRLNNPFNPVSNLNPIINEGLNGDEMDYDHESNFGYLYNKTRELIQKNSDVFGDGTLEMQKLDFARNKFMNNLKKNDFAQSFTSLKLITQENFGLPPYKVKEFAENFVYPKAASLAQADDFKNQINTLVSNYQTTYLKAKNDEDNAIAVLNNARNGNITSFNDVEKSLTRIGVLKPSTTDIVSTNPQIATASKINAKAIMSEYNYVPEFVASHLQNAKTLKEEIYNQIIPVFRDWFVTEYVKKSDKMRFEQQFNKQFPNMTFQDFKDLVLEGDYKSFQFYFSAEKEQSIGRLKNTVDNIDETIESMVSEVRFTNNWDWNAWLLQPAAYTIGYLGQDDNFGLSSNQNDALNSIRGQFDVDSFGEVLMKNNDFKRLFFKKVKINFTRLGLKGEDGLRKAVNLTMVDLSGKIGIEEIRDSSGNKQMKLAYYPMNMMVRNGNPDFSELYKDNDELMLNVNRTMRDQLKRANPRLASQEYFEDFNNAVENNGINYSVHLGTGGMPQYKVSFFDSQGIERTVIENYSFNHRHNIMISAIEKAQSKIKTIPLKSLLYSIPFVDKVILKQEAEKVMNDGDVTGFINRLIQMNQTLGLKVEGLVQSAGGKVNLTLSKEETDALKTFIENLDNTFMNLSLPGFLLRGQD